MVIFIQAIFARTWRRIKISALIDSDKRGFILIVDDNRVNRLIITEILKDKFNVRDTASGLEALDFIAAGNVPDLILLDIEMPGMNGYDVCRQLKANPATVKVPVIFLTGKVTSDDEEMGFSLGAVDYITKPIKENVLLARVTTHFQLKTAADFLEDKAAYLQHQVELRTQEIEAIQDVTVLAMASLAETRDNETGNHLQRTQFYVRALANRLKSHPRFAQVLNEHAITMLFKSAPLHDIGKVGIPDRILLKPGKFTADEFEIMKTHTTLGRDAIALAESRLGVKVDFLTFAQEIAYSHQEKWDGSGYPQGLAGEGIPLSARIMALADVYDALISRRPYKTSMTHEQAMAIISEGKGTHFDPDIVDAFMAISAQFLSISQEFADTDESMEEKARMLEHVLDSKRASPG